VALTRIENDADGNAATLRVVQRVDDDWICEGVGRQVDRGLGGREEVRVDRVEALLG